MPRIWIMSPLFTVFQIFQKWFTVSITFISRKKKKRTSKHISAHGLYKMLTCYSGPHRLQLLLLISAKYYFHCAGLWARAMLVRVQGLLLATPCLPSLQLPLRLLPFRWHWLLPVLSLLGGPGISSCTGRGCAGVSYVWSKVSSSAMCRS